MGAAPTARHERLRDWLRAVDLDLIGALLLIALLLYVLLELGGDPLSIDQHILLGLRVPGDPTTGLGGPRVEGMMRDITALGSSTLAVGFGLAFVGWLLITRRPGAALFVTIAMLGAGLLNEVLKDAFGRERPAVVPHLMGASDLGYPSGHTMVSAVLYPTMAELLGGLVAQRRARFFLMSLAILTALLVGFSRVYLGVHYPSDVLGGLSAGFAWALVCGIAARLLQRRHVFRSKPVDKAEPDESA